MTKLFTSWWRDTRAVAAVEFAMVLPVLITLFYGGIEVTRYILIVQKVEKLAVTVADVTAQSKTLTKASMDQVIDASGEIMKPFDVGANSKIVVSSLYRAAGARTATVNWKYEGGGTLDSHGAIGAVGATPVMPGTFAFDERENVISAEAYYQFTPLVTSDYFGTTTVYRAAFFKPRLGLLTTKPM